MGVGWVIGLVARHRPMMLMFVAPFVLCRPLAASFCCPEGKIGGQKGTWSEMPVLAKRSNLWTPVSNLQEVGGCNCRGLGGRWVVGDDLLWIPMD